MGTMGALAWTVFHPFSSFVLSSIVRTVVKYLPRFRRAYKAMAELEARESWGRSSIEAFQLERLNSIWSNAVERVPFYRDLAARLDLPPRFTRLAAFCDSVPILEKRYVRERPEDFRAPTNHPGRWHRTGGSTGTPMAVYWSKEAHLEVLRGQVESDALAPYEFADQIVEALERLRGEPTPSSTKRAILRLP